MLNTKTKFGAGIALAFAGALALSGCNGGGTAAPETTPAAPPATPDASTPMPEETEDSMMDPMATLVGAGCADYAAQVPDGAGSVEGMSQAPVAVAASNNPLLTTLVAAVSGQLNPEVDLVDTLNSDEYTVFAPVDEAFAAIDPATIETLQTDAPLLTNILTYHVLPERLNPDELSGAYTTLQGTDVEVTGSGDTLMVNGAMVICGGVQTANATVYLIDQVLLPAS